MFDLEAIFSGYYNWITNNHVAKLRATPRLGVCAKCEFLKPGTIVSAKCGKCGCPIKAKVMSRVRNCPLNKWPK